MVKDRSKNLQSGGDKSFIKKKMKAIKEAKKNGNDALAQRHADELYEWLGWE